MIESSSRVAVLVWSMLLLCAHAAYADDPLAKPTAAAARDHLAAGNKLYRLREFDKAIEEYKAGALIEDVPVFYFNLGQCYRQLGRYEDAIWHYDRFLQRGKPTGQIREAVEALRTQMKSELDKKAMTQPPVEPAPESKPAQEKSPKTIRVSSEPWYRDGVGWGLAAGGVVAISVSTWLFVDANSLEKDADGQATQSVRSELRERASSRRTAGVIVGLGGAALLTTGIIKFTLRPHNREQTVTTLRVGFGGDSVFVTGWF